ncbi:ABC transporter permease [Thioclava sp. JE_KL1]|uniref:ABC transporter permease n=1 Tax=Thioclava sp. JE_KL1 TaxID=2651187 RepID=UPI00128DBCA8|nr:ABC transporter permease subunit [Thioclava sp. JE_KL1]MPQ95817.1 ABC transporter permease subunit [Thioclava sp. JE_KL1]
MILSPARWRRPRTDWLRSIATALVALIAWEALARALAGTYLIAGPLEIASYLSDHAGLILRATGWTALAAAGGYVIGNLTAIALAAVAILIPGAARLISSLALIVFCLPLVATGPILRVLWGPGLGPQVTLAALAVYFTTFLPLQVGLRAAPPNWFDLVRSYGRGGWTALVEVRAMAALPYLIAGLQIAAPAAFLGALVGEFTGAERGMGVLTIRAMRSLDVAGTWSLATIAAAVSMLAHAGIGWLWRRLDDAPPPLILASLPDARTDRRWATRLNLILVVLVVIALWWLSMEFAGLNRFFAKRPDDIWAFLVTASGAADHRTTLFAALGQTLSLALPGYALGLALGLGLAIALLMLPALARAIMPLAVALRAIPIVITAPLVVVAMGRGATGTITITAVMTFFPTFIACYQGLKRTPAALIDLFESYAATRWERLTLVQFPAMLPAFFSAARMAVPAAILATTTAEWLATGHGIGGLMALTASTSDYGMLWSSVVLLALVAVAAYAAIERIERAVLRRYGAEQLVR